jgi:hypothetical protein
VVRERPAGADREPSEIIRQDGLTRFFVTIFELPVPGAIIGGTARNSPEIFT